MTSARDIVDRVGSIRPLPDTALKLIQVMGNSRSDLQDIVDTIKYDQAVTGQVLKLCNSAYFGLSRKVTSLNDAMLCLGTVKVLQLVMSFHTNNMLESEQAGYGLEPGVLWRHSVAVALASSLFAERLELTDANLVFTAGLLHDIGKVILNEYVADEFSEIVRRVSEEHLSFAEAEQQVLGFSHEEVGGMIAEKWKLPPAIVDCVRFHHSPSAIEPPNSLVDTVYLANCVCLLFGIGLGEDGLYSRADQAVVDRHHLTERDLETVGAQMLIDLRRVETLFAENPTPESISDGAQA